jgi:hypothetical protein
MISASAAGGVDAEVGVTCPNGILFPAAPWLSRLGVESVRHSLVKLSPIAAYLPTYCTVPPGVELLNAVASAPPPFAK